MPMIEALGAGLGELFSWPGVLIPILGTLLAMTVSFLPGIGSASLMAMMLVLTLSWDATSVLLLFGALTGGATFMGSITAILFNVPGGGPSAAALLDGYPLGRQGYPRTAIACAATASAVGSVFGVVALLAILPFVRSLLLEFGPAERLLLGVWGLTTIVAVPNTSPMKSAAMASLGLLASMVGVAPATGDPRWTFGLPGLEEGFGVVPALLGMFTLAELIGWNRNYRVDASDVRPGREPDSVRAGILAVARHPGLVVRSSLIGTLVGMVPGVGGTVAGFIAYGQAVQSARGDRSRFGKGDIRGVIAPEAAVDAKDGGSLLPAVAFGLPGSEAGVMLVSVFAIHGLVPGAPMLAEQLPMTMTLILALLFSNLLTSVIGVFATPWLAGLTALRVDRIALPALVLSLVAVVQINGNLVDLYAAIGFGIAGFLMKRNGWPRVPFVIAFVLGEFLEGNLTLAVRLVELGRVEPLQRPVTLALLALIAVSMIWMYRKTHDEGARRGPTRADAVIGTGLTLTCGILAADALDQGLPATSISVLVAATGIVLCAPHALRGWGTRAGKPGNDRDGSRTRTTFTMLALTPLAVGAIGLPSALGLLVFAWTATEGPAKFRRLAATFAAGCTVGLACHYLLDEVANLILPRGWLWSAILH